MQIVGFNFGSFLVGFFTGIIAFIVFLLRLYLEVRNNE